MECEMIEGFRVAYIHLDEVDSTNSYARRECGAFFAQEGCPDILVVSADVQSAGRGQRGTVWQSGRGDNLLMSVVVRPSWLAASESYSLSVAAALALKDAMSRFGIEIILKWPNDLYHNGCKLAGILVESDFSGPSVFQTVVGIGLNVNQKSFGAMERRPVSMSVASGRDFCIDEVKRGVVNEFAKRYGELLQGGAERMFSTYLKSLMGYNAPMRYRDADGEFTATVCGIGRDGRIFLKRADGTLSSYTFKEVETVIYGY